MGLAEHIGLCVKCQHKVVATGLITTGDQSMALIGCNIEPHPKNGDNCPLVKQGLHQVVSATFVSNCYTLVIGTTFKGKDGFTRSMTVTSIDSIETAKEMLQHLGFNVECQQV
jgi:hypothetical protein